METFTVWRLLDTWILFVGFLLFLVLFRYFRQPRNLPPGPRGWPIIGNFPQFMSLKSQVFETLSQMTASYGSIISFNLAGKRIVALHGHGTVKEAFGQFQLSARPVAHITESVAPGIGILLSSGEQWLEIRRFCMTVLKGLGVGKSSFEENISAEVENLVEEVKKYRGAAFDPEYVLGNAVSNVICSVVFGKRFKYTDPEFKRLLKVLNDMEVESGAGGMLEFLPVFVKMKRLPFVRRYVEAVENLFRHVHLLVGMHNEKYDPHNPRDLIDIFLHDKQMQENQGIESLALQNDNLERIVVDLFGAGSETTTTTLRWSMLYMMAYPEIQARVQKELDDITCRNRFPRLTDKSDLPYTEAVLSEIQRIETIVPLGLPHMCSENTTLFGYNIPKGSIVFSNIWHNHFDPTVWEEPRTFRPERFLDKDGKFRQREELTPFGIGRRICLGEHLAKMELFIFFTRLLYQFTFRKPDDVPSVSFNGVLGIVWAPATFKVCTIARE